MFSLAPIRYRDILAARGGPIASVETGQLPVRGQTMMIANATLAPGLVCKAPMALFSNADGTGMDRSVIVARHKAVSEALERWAFFASSRSDQAPEYGFDVDPSTTGMSAFPGLRVRGARRSAVLEAIERFCLIAWWEGCAVGYAFQTDWPDVSAFAIEGPLGGVAVVAYARSSWGGYVYGHAAEESVGAACERAVCELARHEWVLRSVCLSPSRPHSKPVTNIFERRLLFFASEEGHALFSERLGAPHRAKMPRAEIICDRSIPGPWTEYAAVWRFALRPPTDGYLNGGERYFFL